MCSLDDIQNDIEELTRKLDRYHADSEQRHIETKSRLDAVATWTQMPDDYDPNNPQEQRNIGEVVRSEVGAAFRDIFSWKRIVAVIGAIGMIVSTINQIWMFLAR